MKVGTIGREREGHDGSPKLLIDSHQRHGRQICPAELLWRIERPEPELLALGEKGGFLLLGQLWMLRCSPPDVTLNDFGLEWYEVLVDEACDELLKHAMLFGQLDGHGAGLQRTLFGAVQLLNTR
jgi:hypothetical protein